MSVKPLFIFDENQKTKTIKQKILKNLKKFSLKLSNVIVVFGGDGFMLETLKKFRKYNKSF